MRCNVFISRACLLSLSSVCFITLTCCLCSKAQMNPGCGMNVNLKEEKLVVKKKKVIDILK